MTDLQECIGGMEMEKFYLGFDAGTQSVKVTVYNEKMECVASTSAPTTLTYPHPGWVDMDVDEYLALTINGMAECSRQMVSSAESQVWMKRAMPSHHILIIWIQEPRRMKC